MTDKTRAPRNSVPLTAHSAIGKIRAIYADQERRIAELKAADNDKARAIADRVDGDKETQALVAMLTALGIAVPEMGETPPAADDEPPVDDIADIPSRPAVEEYAEPRGVTEYVPGAAARAARGMR